SSSKPTGLQVVKVRSVRPQKYAVACRKPATYPNVRYYLLSAIYDLSGMTSTAARTVPKAPINRRHICSCPITAREDTTRRITHCFGDYQIDATRSLTQGPDVLHGRSV